MQVVATIKIKVVCICCVLLVYLNNIQGDQPIPAQSAQQNITMGQKHRSVSIAYFPIGFETTKEPIQASQVDFGSNCGTYSWIVGYPTNI
jgi:hypothetical protein